MVEETDEGKEVQRKNRTLQSQGMRSDTGWVSQKFMYSAPVAGDSLINKTDMVLILMEITIHWQRQMNQVSKETNQ